MGAVGNVWWAQTLGVSSLIQKEASSTLHLRVSASLSSRGLLLLPPHPKANAVFGRKEKKLEIQKGCTCCFFVSFFFWVFLVFLNWVGFAMVMFRLGYAR